jgi:hypothetical protein
MWFNPGWAWFLPILPYGYATYYWGGVPYYYWNDLYYTYSPADSGYVVTEPPPVSGNDNGTAQPPDSGGAPPADSGGAYGDAGGQYNAPAAAGQYGSPPVGATQAAPGGSAPDLYLYPRNHQTDQQMATDRYECHSWAVGQTGFDPTRSGAQSGSTDDYRRAMIACLDARGYSAR